MRFSYMLNVHTTQLSSMRIKLIGANVMGEWRDARLLWRCSVHSVCLTAKVHSQWRNSGCVWEHSGEYAWGTGRGTAA